MARPLSLNLRTIKTKSLRAQIIPGINCQLKSTSFCSKERIRVCRIMMLILSRITPQSLSNQYFKNTLTKWQIFLRPKILLNYGRISILKGMSMIMIILLGKTSHFKPTKILLYSKEGMIAKRVIRKPTLARMSRSTTSLWATLAETLLIVVRSNSKPMKISLGQHRKAIFVKMLMGL